MSLSETAPSIHPSPCFEPESGPRRYDMAVALVLAAALLRLILSALGMPFVFATFYPAVMLAALSGGVREGLLATVLSVAVAGAFWIEPLGALIAPPPFNLLGVAIFVVNGFLVSWVAEKVQQVNLRRRRAEAARRVELERLVDERTLELSKQIAEREAAEARMSLALAATESGIWEWTLATGRNVWSDNLWGLFDLEATGQESSYELWEQSVHPDDRARVAQLIGAEAAAGREFETSWRVNTPAGAPERWLLSRGRPVMGADGKPERYLGIVIDITERKREVDVAERKRAEAALRESEERFQALFETMPDGCAYGRMVYDETGQPVDFIPLAANSAFDRQSGVDSVVGKRVTQALPQMREALPRLIETFGRVARSGRPERFTIEFKPTARWLNVSVCCPGPDHFVAIFDDITERKQAEDALQSSEKRLKAFLDNSALVAWLKDEHGRYVFMSENFRRQAGLRLEDALDKTDFDLFPPAVAESCKASDLAALAAEAPIESLEAVPKADGSLGWWLNNKFTYLDSSGRRYVGGLGVDIAARVEAEAALRKSEQRLQRFYNSGLLGLFYWNRNGLVVDANDKFLEMTGYQRGDLAAGRIDWRRMVPPEFENLNEQSYAELMALGANSAPFEQEYVRKDGSRLPVLIAAAMLDETRYDGVSFVVDITERRQAQQALVLAKAEAERANIAKSKFLAAASHDLRQPLQSLTALLRVIEAQIANRQAPNRALKKAQDAVNSLNGLLRGILDIARLDAGVVEPVKSSVDLREMLTRLADEYGARAAETGLALRFAPRALRIHTDPTLLERIVRNLIENALRYTRSGGVLIGLRRRGAHVRLDVIDTGVGIPADKQGEIFQEFHQLNNPGRDASLGLGLGLAIVARLARLLDVEVAVSSRLGRGTRFSLLLPLERTPPAPVEARRAVVGSGGRILVIDDDEAVRDAHETLLECMGYEVRSADTGERALTLAEREQWRFDAILADYRLGAGLTGTETATEISRRAGFAIPTVILTGDTAVEPILEVAATDFVMLHKPADPDELLEILASLSSGEDRSRHRARSPCRALS